MNLRRALSSLALVIGAILFSAGLQTFAAFTQPSTAAPGNDAYAPLHTGTDAQSKVGGLLLNTGGAVNGLIVQNGKVGIGDPAPAYKLTVKTAQDDYGFVQTDGTVKVGSYVDNSGGWFGTISNHPLYFYTNDSAAQMTLLTNGNVGIGTSNPGAKLEISAANPSVYINPTGAAGSSSIWLRSAQDSGAPLRDWRIQATGGNSVDRFSILNSSSGTTPFTITGGDNVGIGTVSPTAKLEVAGNIKIPAINNVTAGSFVYSSDERLKKEITTLSGALEKVLNLRGVQFKWKNSDDSENIGFIAQEVEKIVPQVVRTGSDGLKSVEYGNIVPLLVEAMKEQQKEIDSLKAEIKLLKDN